MWLCVAPSSPKMVLGEIEKEEIKTTCHHKDCKKEISENYIKHQKIKLKTFYMSANKLKMHHIHYVKFNTNVRLSSEVHPLELKKQKSSFKIN